MADAHDAGAVLMLWANPYGPSSHTAGPFVGSCLVWVPAKYFKSDVANVRSFSRCSRPVAGHSHQALAAGFRVVFQLLLFGSRST